jgi:hypothetical protein
MRSFSSFKPVVHDVTPREAKSAKFAMWLRANAFNVRRPFDRATWRTARPWLSYEEVRYELKRFRDRSLGSLQLGSISLKNKDVETAVKYEALATRNIFQLDISEMIFNFYDLSKHGREPKRSVLDKINEEFIFLDRGTVVERDRNWKIAIKPLTKGKMLMLKPKIREQSLACLILELFEICDEPISLDKIQAQITPCLNVSHQKISAPLLRRALAITGVNLRYKNHLEIINGIIDKYYVRHKLGKEDPERLKSIVNQKVLIPHDNAVWSLLDYKIVPRHDYVSEEYEQAFNEDYHDAPTIAPLQLPFFRHVHPYMYIRKKQKICWKSFMDKCTRSGGTDARTLDRANAMLIDKGFVPYEHCHPEFDTIKVQGLIFDAS